MYDDSPRQKEDTEGRKEQGQNGQKPAAAEAREKECVFCLVQIVQHELQIYALMNKTRHELSGFESCSVAVTSS
jgi:hypothetical protein